MMCWCEFTISAHGPCWESASVGHLECLIKAYNSGFNITKETIEITASNGFVNCLKWFRENNFILSFNLLQKIVEFNQVECLDFMIEDADILENLTTYNNLMEIAVEFNSYECLVRLFENNCYTPIDFVSTVASNELKYLELVCSYNLDINELTMENTVESGRLENIIYLYNNFPKLRNRNIYVCNAAAYSGDIKCLEWACDRYNYDSTIYENILLSNNEKNMYNIFKYMLVVRKCPMPEKICRIIALRDKYDCFILAYQHEADISYTCYSVNNKPYYIKYLQFCLDKGVKLQIDIYRSIVQICNVDIVKFIFRKLKSIYDGDINLLDNICYYAILGHKYQNLKYLHKKGYSICNYLVSFIINKKNYYYGLRGHSNTKIKTDLENDNKIIKYLSKHTACNIKILECLQQYQSNNLVKILSKNNNIKKQELINLLNSKHKFSYIFEGYIISKIYNIEWIFEI
jgi:hypothetical protein